MPAHPQQPGQDSPGRSVGRHHLAPHRWTMTAFSRPGPVYALPPELRRKLAAARRIRASWGLS